MEKRFLTTVVLFLITCTILCGCGTFGTPFGEVEVPSQPETVKYSIYICGAVEREGYYEVEAGTDYAEVLRLAGILPESILPTLSSSYVDGSIKRIIVGYFDGENAHSSINANSALIAARMSVDGLTDEVVNKLADYIDEYGKIANKQQLEQALGEDYAENYYKLFIADIDYEID